MNTDSSISPYLKFILKESLTAGSGDQFRQNTKTRLLLLNKNHVEQTRHPGSSPSIQEQACIEKQKSVHCMLRAADGLERQFNNW